MHKISTCFQCRMGFLWCVHWLQEPNLIILLLTSDLQNMLIHLLAGTAALVQLPSTCEKFSDCSSGYLKTSESLLNVNSSIHIHLFLLGKQLGWSHKSIAAVFWKSCIWEVCSFCLLALAGTVNGTWIYIFFKGTLSQFSISLQIDAFERLTCNI